MNLVTGGLLGNAGLLVTGGLSSGEEPPARPEGPTRFVVTVTPSLPALVSVVAKQPEGRLIP